MRLDRLVCKRDRYRDTILRTQVSCDVTLPSRVFDQIDVARTDSDLLASRYLDLSPAAERDDELAPGSDMPVVRVVRRSPAELHSGSFHHLGCIAVQFHFDLFSVTQPIRARVDARHHDGFPCLRNDDENQQSRDRFHRILLDWLEGVYVKIPRIAIRIDHRRSLSLGESNAFFSLGV